MKNTAYILFGLTIFMFGLSYGQQGKISTAVKKYDKLHYIASRAALLDLATKDDVSPEVIEKLANTYYYNSEMLEASKWYEKLIALQPDADAENYFRYAQALKAKEDYVKANEMLNIFAKRRPQDSRAIRFVNQQDYLKTIEAVSKDYALENLAINTRYSDFGTAIHNDKLIFASSRAKDGKNYKWNDQPFLDIYELDSEGKVNEIAGDVNTKYHESVTAFTKDGTTVYFTRNNYFKGKFKKNNENIHALKIYKATLVDGAWVNVTPLPFNSDEYSVAHPTLNVDNTKLYFASDMPGTKGMSDIFVVDIFEDGSYSTPVNLGPKINTEGRENFPFISDAGDLYFSSNGHPGLGGLDVFRVNVADPKSTEIINVGTPVNSPKDDFGYRINSDARSGYVSSNRPGGKGDDDIYSFKIPDCKYDIAGKVIDKKTGLILANADVVLKDGEDNVLETLKSAEDGSFNFSLDCTAQNYKVEAKKEKYKDDVTDFVVNTKKSDTLSLQLALESSAAKLGTDLAVLLNLNPIYFGYDKSFIRPDAELELIKVIKYMQAYPSVKIDVRSHTDSRGRDAYNLGLSQRRNESTRAYIINVGGISANRITGKGYGETQLTNRCSNGVKCSDEEHQANRRSEFIVVDN